MTSSFFASFLVVALASSALAYSNGAPKEACDDMTPQHGVGGQNTTIPYTFQISPKAIRAGDEVKLTVTGKSPRDKVKGFLIQARAGGKNVGKFIVEQNDKFVQTLDCGNKPASAVTHKKHEEKDDKRSFSVSWVAPADLKDSVEFQSTIALNGGTFWIAKKSDVLKIH